MPNTPFNGIGTRGMVPLWVMRHISQHLSSRCQARAIWVYTAIEAHCRDDDEEITREQISGSAGLSIDTLKRGMTDLEEIGLLRRTPQYRDNMRVANQYHIVVTQHDLQYRERYDSRRCSEAPTSVLHRRGSEAPRKESEKISVLPSSKKHIQMESPLPTNKSTPDLPAVLDQTPSSEQPPLVERESKIVTPDPKPGRSETEAQRRRRLSRVGWTPKQITLMIQGKLDEQGQRTELWDDTPAAPPARPGVGSRRAQQLAALEAFTARTRS